MPLLRRCRCLRGPRRRAHLFVPQLLGAQYTLIAQHQSTLRSPYSGPLSLRADGASERSHAFGAYFGVALPAHLQFYFDIEMFKGEGVSNATGLGGFVNGDVVHSGNAGLGKRAYVARRYLRWTLPLGDGRLNYGASGSWKRTMRSSQSRTSRSARMFSGCAIPVTTATAARRISSACARTSNTESV